MTARCQDCGRFVRADQVEPIPICDPCIDWRLLGFSPLEAPIQERV